MREYTTIQVRWGCRLIVLRQVGMISKVWCLRRILQLVLVVAVIYCNNSIRYLLHHLVTVYSFQCIGLLPGTVSLFILVCTRMRQLLLSKRLATLEITHYRTARTTWTRLFRHVMQMESQESRHRCCQIVSNAMMSIQSAVALISGQFTPLAHHENIDFVVD